MNRALLELLEPERLTEIVDVGANPIGRDPPYKAMLSAGLCNVTGFEPQESALKELLATKGANERYFPYVLGDGAPHTLNFCHAKGMTSLFEPDPASLDLFNLFSDFGKVTHQEEVQTHRLDEIREVDRLDYLKLDVQGSELMILQAGWAKLADAVAIQTEVSFITLYKDQPTLGEIDSELRSQDFVPHCFAQVKTWPISPCVVNENPKQGLFQLLEADMVYIRDISKPEQFSDEQLKQLALIAHYCYGSIDLALRCIVVLSEREAVAQSSSSRYLSSSMPGTS